MPSNLKPIHVIIVGAGFAGIEACAQLLKSGKRIQRLRVTLVDRKDYFVFTPALLKLIPSFHPPSWATISYKRILPTKKNLKFIKGTVNYIDFKHQKITVSSRSKPLQYDYLVLATGLKPKQGALNAHSETSAFQIRKNFFFALSQAEQEPDLKARESWLNFAVVGGGIAGCGLAQSLSELKALALKSSKWKIRPNEIKIHLLEREASLTPKYPPAVSKTYSALAKKHKIIIHIKTEVLRKKKSSLIIKQGKSKLEMPCRNVFETEGAHAEKFSLWAKESGVKIPTDSAGRIDTQEDLSVPGLTNVFAVGDTCLFKIKSNRIFGGTLRMAAKQGLFVGRLLAQRIQHQRSENQSFYQSPEFLDDTELQKSLGFSRVRKKRSKRK